MERINLMENFKKQVEFEAKSTGIFAKRITQLSQTLFLSYDELMSVLLELKHNGLKTDKTSELGNRRYFI